MEAVLSGTIGQCGRRVSSPTRLNRRAVERSPHLCRGGLASLKGSILQQFQQFGVRIEE